MVHPHRQPRPRPLPPEGLAAFHKDVVEAAQAGGAADVPAATSLKPAFHAAGLRHRRVQAAPHRGLPEDGARGEGGVVVSRRETWTTEDCGTSHRGAVEAVLPGGSVPAPVFFDSGSGGGGVPV